jgi:hypothetical protein
LNSISLVFRLQDACNILKAKYSNKEIEEAKKKTEQEEMKEERTSTGITKTI